MSTTQEICLVVAAIQTSMNWNCQKGVQFLRCRHPCAVNTSITAAVCHQ